MKEERKRRKEKRMMMMMNKKTARKKGMHRQNIIKYRNILLTEDLFFLHFSFNV
jgi:hypothetical protein